MAKVAIKNENITSFGGIYHVMDVFSKLGFAKLTESVFEPPILLQNQANPQILLHF